MDALIPTMRYYYRIIWCLGLYWSLANASSEENLKELDFRAKRQINALPLVYPYGATYKLITGYTAPIKNDDKIGLIFLFNFQYQYLQFTNITELSQYYVINSVSREQRDAEVAARKNERIVFYRAVAEMMDALFNIQYQYLQFTNITQLSQYYVINSVSREQRGAEVAARKNERILFYRAVAEMMDALFNIQYQYLQFTNITQLSQYYVINSVSREQRDAEVAARKNERIVFYRAVAEMMDAKGLNGRECVLRAICEAAQFPVEEEGFVGEILHVLLTPDYGQSPFGDQDEDLKEALIPYVDAAVAGRQMFSCSYIYHDCPEGQGILEFISQLRDE